MSENRVLRRMFGPKRDEVTEEWRKVHNEVLNDLYCVLSRVWWSKSGTPLLTERQVSEVK